MNFAESANQFVLGTPEAISRVRISYRAGPPGQRRETSPSQEVANQSLRANARK
jgi:hypothetical protein